MGRILLIEVGNGQQAVDRGEWAKPNQFGRRLLFRQPVYLATSLPAIANAYGTRLFRRRSIPSPQAGMQARHFPCLNNLHPARPC